MAFFLKNKLKHMIILIVLLSSISINSVFADVEYAESMYGTFEIDGMVVEGTIFAQSIDPGDGCIRVSSPWIFYGHDNAGNPIIIGSDSQGKTIIVLPPSGNSNLINENQGSSVNSYIEKDFNITYNSTDEVLQIASDSKSVDVSIFDLSGKTVYSNAGANLSVNTNNLPQADGIYILKAVLDGQTITKKFIISNGNCIFSPANSITKIKSAAIDTSRLPKIKGTYIIKNKLPDDINTIRVIKTK